MSQYPEPKNKKIPFKSFPKTHSIWNHTKDIRYCKERINTCPVCKTKLTPSYTMLPYLPDKKYKVTGYECRKCFCLYTSEAYYVEQVMLDNELSKGFTLDGISLWNYSAVIEQQRREKELKQQEKLNKERIKKDQSFLARQCQSAELLIRVRFDMDSKTEDKKIIICKSPNDEDIERNIILYKSEIGREFLSAAFATARNKHGSVGPKSFIVLGEAVFKENKLSDVTYNIMPENLFIRPGGGYIGELKNKFCEIVDLLVYSPYTQRYELMKATYNNDSYECYTDVSIYRTFIKKYGNPGIIPYFMDKNGFYKKAIFKDCNLQESSLLNDYGYNVNARNNLSAADRQEILSEIIDLGIVQVYEVADFLSWLIRTRSQHPEARMKWQKDLEFVEQYQPNQERFLIVKGSF